jgi:hypothetical protein
MDGRDERIYEEAAALWRELHDDAEPVDGDGAKILDLITGTLPEVGYDRICSPYLRPSTITGPKTRKTG